MKERPSRIYQQKFDAFTLDTTSHDVTPAVFTGLEFPKQEVHQNQTPNRLGRYVREASDPVCINSPEIAAQYLMNYVYTPFCDFDQ